MRQLSNEKRIAAGVVGVIAAIATGLGTPAQALATCPDNHVCFYQEFREENGLLFPAGTMSDQTAWLINKPRTIRIPISAHGSAVDLIDTDGAISNFENSRYTNGSGLNDSISVVVNNSNRCLFMFGNKDWLRPDGHPREAVQFGPHTARVLVGDNLGDSHDRLSSAFTVPPGHQRCTVGENDYRLI